MRPHATPDTLTVVWTIAVMAPGKFQCVRERIHAISKLHCLAFQQIPPPKEEGPKVVNGEHSSTELRELDQVREEDENEEDEKDERVKGEELEGGPEEADVDDNDLDEDEAELNDTFTAHRRQRANFYKIFVQRASYHRHHNQRSKNGEVQTSIELNTPPPESISVLPTSKTSSNSIITMAPPNRRGSSAALKRTSMTSGRTKSMNFMKSNFSVESIYGELNLALDDLKLTGLDGFWLVVRGDWGKTD
ncbi:hypothetical protein ACTXT7_014959 [Hymenolepis weldensis]